MRRDSGYHCCKRVGQWVACAIVVIGASTARSSPATQRIIEELEATPVVDVVGVIGASGVGGGSSRGDEKWTLVFQLPAWRYAGQPLRVDTLTVRQLVEREAIDAMRQRLKPYQVVRLKARVSEQNSFHRPEALLLDIVDANANDTELAGRAAELQKPVTLVDPTLGTFTFNRALDMFETRADWRGDEVRVALMVNSEADRDLALANAHTLFSAQPDWDRRVRDLVVAKLLPLKNEVWLQDGEAELTAKQFESRVRLEAIHVHADGHVEFWYADGDLFWGHSIQVGGTLADGPSSADLAG